MKRLSNHGNGNYSYIDNLLEAKKVLINEMGCTLLTVAKDVKLQIEFNPEYVTSYRLIGYEDRLLNEEDFNDDTKDAAEMGAGHTVTALYELIPTHLEDSIAGSVDPLKYQKISPTDLAKNSGEIATVKFRYKMPKGKKSQLITHPISNTLTPFQESSLDFRFSAAAANFGMLLRKSRYTEQSSWQEVLQMAKSAKGLDEEGYRAEFIQMIQQAELIEMTSGTDLEVKRK